MAGDVVTGPLSGLSGHWDWLILFYRITCLCRFIA